MPMYQYECEECDYTVTKQRSVLNRNKPVICHNCGKEMIRKFFATPIHFKGSGFYINDYKKEDK